MSKKSNVQDPEELQMVESALSTSEAFVEKHLKELIIATVVIVLVFVGFFMFKYKYLAPRELKAQDQISAGQAYFTVDSFALALNGDGMGYIGFKKIAEDYKMTKTAKIAKVYAGVCCQRLNQQSEAIEYLKGFDADENLITPAVLVALADCYVEMNDYAAAEKSYKKAVKEAENDLIASIATKKMAAMYVAQNKYDEALDCYTTLKEKYAQTQAAYEVDRYIEYVKALKTAK